MCAPIPAFYGASRVKLLFRFYLIIRVNLPSRFVSLAARLSVRVRWSPERPSIRAGHNAGHPILYSLCGDLFRALSGGLPHLTGGPQGTRPRYPGRSTRQSELTLLCYFCRFPPSVPKCRTRSGVGAERSEPEGLGLDAASTAWHTIAAGGKRLPLMFVCRLICWRFPSMLFRFWFVAGLARPSAAHPLGSLPTRDISTGR